MRHDRTFWRLAKFAILFGALSLVGEGLLGIGKLTAVFLHHQPSDPGQSKIIEHFALQHVLLPALALLLAFWPAWLKSLFVSPIIRIYLGALVVLVTIPELLVSFRSDLFRPYVFNLHSAFLSSIQMVEIWRFHLNVIQAQHLIFAHLVLMGTVLALCVRPSALRHFAGPRTGEESFG